MPRLTLILPLSAESTHPIAIWSRASNTVSSNLLSGGDSTALVKFRAISAEEMGLGVVIAQPAIQQFTDSSFQHLGAAAGAQRRICLRCWDTRETSHDKLSIKAHIIMLINL